MDLLNNITKKQSFVKDFYGRWPAFDPRDHAILDHRPAVRWFNLLKYGDETDLYNFQEVIQGKSGIEVTVRDKRFYMMSSYDYLSLIGNQEIEEASIKAIREYGTSTGGVRLLTGTNELHLQLERELSKFKGTEACMVLSSGYMANIGAVAGLFGKQDLVLTDQNIHRSII